MWPFQPLFNQFILHLVNATCVWPNQHRFNPLLWCLIYLTGIRSIHPVIDWSMLYLIEHACIWSIWSAYDPWNLFLIYWVCNWLVQPVHDLLYLILFYSNCVELIQAVFDQFHLYMTRTRTFFKLFDPANFFVTVQFRVNLYLTDSICNQSIPKARVYSWFHLNNLFDSDLPASDLELDWCNMYCVDSTPWLACAAALHWQWHAQRELEFNMHHDLIHSESYSAQPQYSSSACMIISDSESLILF